VSPLLPALALVACFAVGLRGIALVRDRGPASRLEAVAVRAPSERRPGGLLLSLLDLLAVRLERPMAGLLGSSGSRASSTCSTLPVARSAWARAASPVAGPR
jgi:hypothetical protein